MRSWTQSLLSTAGSPYLAKGMRILFGGPFSSQMIRILGFPGDFVSPFGSKVCRERGCLERSQAPICFAETWKTYAGTAAESPFPEEQDSVTSAIADSVGNDAFMAAKTACRPDLSTICPKRNKSEKHANSHLSFYQRHAHLVFTWWQVHFAPCMKALASRSGVG